MNTNKLQKGVEAQAIYDTVQLAHQRNKAILDGYGFVYVQRGNPGHDAARAQWHTSGIALCAAKNALDAINEAETQTPIERLHAAQDAAAIANKKVQEAWQAAQVAYREAEDEQRAMSPEDLARLAMAAPPDYDPSKPAADSVTGRSIAAINASDKTWPAGVIAEITPANAHKPAKSRWALACENKAGSWLDAHSAYLHSQCRTCGMAYFGPKHADLCKVCDDVVNNTKVSVGDAGFNSRMTPAQAALNKAIAAAVIDSLFPKSKRGAK